MSKDKFNGMTFTVSESFRRSPVIKIYSSHLSLVVLPDGRQAAYTGLRSLQHDICGYCQANTLLGTRPIVTSKLDLVSSLLPASTEFLECTLDKLVTRGMCACLIAADEKSDIYPIVHATTNT